MNPDVEVVLARVALAFGIGLLVGLERGWRSRDPSPGSRTAGVSTFGISGLLGGMAGALARDSAGPIAPPGGLIIGAAFAAFSVVGPQFGRDENQASGVRSATTTIAALL